MGTHARVLSQTLAHGNSKNEVRQRNSEEGKKRGASIERSKAGTKKKEVLTAYDINNKQNIIVFYKIWKKYNEIQLTKIKMDLNNRKMTNHPAFPGTIN